MNTSSFSKLLPILLRHKGSINITVSGISMTPTLTAGNLITISPYTIYVPGDILVYQYKNEGLLVHRLLLTEGASNSSTLYHCKGDNAFRLETISYQDIIGKVTAVDNFPISPWPDWKTKLSYAVHLQYKQCEHGVVQAKETDIYRLYALLIHNQTDTNLFPKNRILDVAQNFCLSFQVPFCEIKPFLQKALAEH